MLNETDRYDAETPTQTIIGADDPKPPAAIVTQTAAQIAALSSETMDPAPKKGKGKPAAAKPQGKAEEPGTLYYYMRPDNTFESFKADKLQEYARRTLLEEGSFIVEARVMKVNVTVA